MSIRVILFFLLLLRYDLTAQLQLAPADSLQILLEYSQKEEIWSNIISPHFEDIFVDPITIMPRIKNCDEAEQPLMMECLSAEIERIVKSQVQIPSILQDSSFFAKVYVQVRVDTNARVEKIEIVRGAEYYLEDKMKFAAPLLNHIAMKPAESFEFVQAAYWASNGRKVKIAFTYPVTFNYLH